MELLGQRACACLILTDTAKQPAQGLHLPPHPPGHGWGCPRPCSLPNLCVLHTLHHIGTWRPLDKYILTVCTRSPMLITESFQNRTFPLSFHNNTKANEEKKLHIQKCQLAREQHHCFNYHVMPSLAPRKLSWVGALGAGGAVARARHVEAVVHADWTRVGQSLHEWNNESATSAFPADKVNFRGKQVQPGWPIDQLLKETFFLRMCLSGTDVRQPLNCI